MFAALIFAIGVYIAVIYLPRTHKRPSWRRSVRKTLPVALFALAMLIEGHLVLAAALALGAVGDYALSRPGEKAFLAGMVAFALAHLAYVGLFVLAGADMAAAPWIGIGALVALGISTEVWLAPHTGALRWPVRGYVAIILAMGLSALALPAGMIWVKAGACLFILSDFILSIETFRLAPEHPARWALSKLVWITYIAAQAALTIGLGLLVG